MSAEHKIIYRPDIDGLRAFAVLTVAIYHAFPAYLPAGFIGVDVFFVISGFLISSIIITESKNNSFSMIEFYTRRILRIFPSLLTILVFCICYGWFILLPNEYSQLGKHIIGAVTFVSNFVLWNESGYFDVSAAKKPLLHLWSLGIEEQFYIFWPILILLSIRLKNSLLKFILFVFVLSFIINIFLGYINSAGDFFMPLARFWELALGALVALSVANNSNLIPNSLIKLESRHIEYLFVTKVSYFYSIVSYFGLVLLLLGHILIDAHNTYPYFWALFPSAGTALIIYSGANLNTSLIYRFFSNPIMVWIGLISYPIYLWHWPLLSFGMIAAGNNNIAFNNFIAIILSFILAYLTYHFVELPFRDGKSRKLKSSMLLGCSAIIGFFGFLIYHSYFHRDIAEKAAILDKYSGFSGYPRPNGLYNDPEYGLPSLGRNHKTKLVVLGDSHAEQYINTFDVLLSKKNNQQEEIPQILFKITYDEPLSDIRDQYIWMLKDNSIKTVIISYFWALRYKSPKINYSVRCCGDGPMGSVGGHIPLPLTEKQIKNIDSELELAVKSLKESGKNVIFVLDNPFGEELAPQFMIQERSLLHGIQFNIQDLAIAKAIERSQPMRDRVISIAKNSDSAIIDPVEFLCNTHSCPSLSPQGFPLYKDYDHLSSYTVTKLVNYFDKLLK